MPTITEYSTLRNKAKELNPNLLLHELHDRLTEWDLRAGINSMSRFYKRRGIIRRRTQTTFSKKGGK